LTVPAARRTLLCSDVLDPPLLPEIAERVIALNMLDSVANPRTLLAVIDGLCAPGGEVILASPYQWQSGVMAEHERLPGADPGATLVEILRQGAGLSHTYTVEDEAEIAWTLRRDARSSVSYRTHYVRARKGT
jgi:2-polyprenyl-3-methyl-5-hydroxy-6-metoxy-1,4-benzoquinol methylase